MAKIARILMPAAALVAGLAAGSGTAYATAQYLGLHGGKKAAPEAVDTVFVPTGPIMAPLVFPDGRLAGYVSFQVQLEVETDRGEEISPPVTRGSGVQKPCGGLAGPSGDPCREGNREAAPSPFVDPHRHGDHRLPLRAAPRSRFRVPPPRGPRPAPRRS